MKLPLYIVCANRRGVGGASNYIIKMDIYYDKSTCNKNMIRHLPYIHTRYKLSIKHHL